MLKRIIVCSEGKEYLQKYNLSTIKTAWWNCNRGDWLLYILSFALSELLHKETTSYFRHMRQLHRWIKYIHSKNEFLQLQLNFNETGEITNLFYHDNMFPANDYQKKLNKQLADTIKFAVNFDDLLKIFQDVKII